MKLVPGAFILCALSWGCARPCDRLADCHLPANDGERCAVRADFCGADGLCQFDCNTVCGPNTDCNSPGFVCHLWANGFDGRCVGFAPACASDADCAGLRRGPWSCVDGVCDSPNFVFAHAR